MKILFFLRYFRDKASSRTRGFYLAEALSKKKKVCCEIVCGNKKGNYLRFLWKLIRHDIVCFQKKYSGIDIILNKLMRLLGKKTLFDIDDAPFGLYYSNRAYKQAIMMIKASSAVIVGSHKLKNFAQSLNHNTWLIPSSINLDCYRPLVNKKDHGCITLGWIGDGVGYKDDLLMLLEPLQQVGKNYNIKLLLIGALKQKQIHDAFSKLNNVKVKIIDEIDWANPEAVPGAIANFDIGLYPLLDNDYNQYKCGFKALEYMAMEVPVVASPVGENKFIIEDGKDGFLAGNAQDWSRHLSYLIEQAQVRKKMGEAGRDKIEQNYALEICANKFLEVLGKI